MSAWVLAALFCTNVSAAVVEIGGEAASVAPVPGVAAGAGASVSPISAVPGASVLAPSLNLGAVLKAFPGQAAAGLPAGAASFAPAPKLPAAASAPAPRQDASSRSEAAPVPASRELTPPPGAAGAASPRAIASDRRAAASPDGASLRLDAAGRELAPSPEEAGALQGAPAEAAAALGRKVFDQAAGRTSLAEASVVATRAGSSLEPSGTGAKGDALRDAVASPVPAAAAPGGVFAFFRVPAFLGAPFRGAPATAPEDGAAAVPGDAAAPTAFERLSLELGSGLVVKVRAALGLAPAAAPLFSDAPSGASTSPAASSAPRATRAPITSTEWLERRGLLESLSVTEAAESQKEAAALPPAGISPERAPARFAPALAGRAVAAAPGPVFDPRTPARVPALALWGLAFLPAAFFLLKELR